jgi:hypothetical protein
MLQRTVDHELTRRSDQWYGNQEIEVRTPTRLSDTEKAIREMWRIIFAIILWLGLYLAGATLSSDKV